MKIAVPREIIPGENRVAIVPETCKKLVKAGFEVAVECGAGEASYISDGEFRDAGAVIESSVVTLLGSADIVCKVQHPVMNPSKGHDEVELFKEGSMLLATLYPTRNTDAVKRLAERRITAFSTDCIPRTTRAQSMDTLSSMANISGYKGVLIAAAELPKYFPMFMTAAGTVFAAKVFVIGAGVAGLQAIATAKRLGATVTATDVRPEVKEQIESVGGKYIGVELKQSAAAGGGYAKELSEEDKAKQRELLVEHCGTVDVVITTALIGGVFAPKLITADMVRKMKPGAVIVDLAAEGGGNCELTQPGQTVVESGVKICGPMNLPSSMPNHASTLYARNLANFILAFSKDGKFNVDLADEIIKGATVTHEGQVLHAGARKALGIA